MKIRNTGTNPIIFNGGVAIPNRTVTVDDVIGKSLAQAYNFIEVIEETQKAEVLTSGYVDNSHKEDEVEQLRAKAKELNIKGYALMKAETLRVKLEETQKAEAEKVQ